MGELFYREHQPHFHFPFAFHVHEAARLADKAILDQLIRGARDLDGIAHPMRLHAAGNVHGIAPHVINEFPFADHPSDDRTGIDADSKADLLAVAKYMGSDKIAHFQRHADQSLRMIRAWTRYARGHHVTVTDGSDLF